MTSLKKQAYNKLIDCGIKPSSQRTAILEYLLSHHTHPTVEEVYKSVLNEIPTLSITTVYNTLRLFSEKQAATMLTIDDHRICYDGVTTPHAHFYCKQCGTVIDVLYEGLSDIQTDNVMGNQVTEVHLCFKGLCQKCQSQSESQS